MSNSRYHELSTNLVHRSSLHKRHSSTQLPKKGKKAFSYARVLIGHMIQKIGSMLYIANPRIYEFTKIRTFRPFFFSQI